MEEVPKSAVLENITQQGLARRKSVINREQRENAKKQNNETGYLGRQLC
jgi:hypothetical protein